MAESEWEGDFDPLADEEERKHLLSVLDSFRWGDVRFHRDTRKTLT